MLYDNKLKETMVDILNNRVSAIADTIQVLLNEGYLPNKNKNTILSWSSILIDAYQNVDILSKEQQDKLDRIYNKILKL